MKCAICSGHVLSGLGVHPKCLQDIKAQVLAEVERRILALPQPDGISATDLAFKQGVAMALNPIKDMQAGR